MARNTTPHTSTFDFPVTVEPLNTQDGFPTGLFGTIRRDSTGVRTFNSLSEKYGLLRNSDMVEQIEAGFSKAGLTGWDREAFVYDHGARTEFQWTFKNRTIRTPKKGDQMAFRITARNSYDGSWRASLVDSVVRLVCSNGMTREETGYGLSKKHTQSLDMGLIVSGLEHMLGRFDQWAQDMDILVVPVSQAQGSAILSRAQDSGVISGTVREGILGFWNAPRRAEDEERTLANLYNAGTEYLSTVLSRERHQHSQTLNGRWTGHVMGLGRDRHALAEAMQPVLN